MTANTRILYMEDDWAVASLIQVKLAKLGYAVDVAPDGRAGLAAYAAGRHDLLLVDQSMPGLDGLGVVRELAAEGPLPPTIIVTGTGDEATAVEAMRMGVSDYLVKDRDAGYLKVLPLAIDRAIDRGRLAEQKREAEKALLASEQKFRGHFDQALIGMAILAEDGGFVEINGEFCRMLGFAREELLQTAWSAIVHPNDLDTALGQFRQVIEGEVEGYRVERRLLHKDGRLMHTDLSVRCFRGEDGCVDHLFVMARDITSRVEAEEALRRRTKQLDERVRELDCLRAISRLLEDADTTVVQTLDAVLELIPPAWQYSEITCARIILDDIPQQTGNFRGTPWMIRAPIVVEGRMTGMLEVGYLEECPSADEGPFTKEERLLLRTIAEHLGRVLERRRMKEELAQAQRLEAIGQLAAGIAHEINTPIQYVGDNIRFLQEGFGELRRVMDAAEPLLAAVQQGQPPAEAAQELQSRRDEADLDYLAEEIPRAIEQSLDGVDRVAQIVRAMKQFSHPGGGEKQAVDLNKAIENTLTVSRNEWKYVAKLVTDFDPELPLVPVLLGSFNQAILNLVMNAAQAIAANLGKGSTQTGTITVSTCRAGDCAEIRVADTGCGIPDSIRDRVFDPFFTTKEVGKGTGQGLAIVHNIIVEEHGGSISFESRIGKGTTFLVRLPLGTTTSPDRPEPSAAAGPHHPSPEIT